MQKRLATLALALVLVLLGKPVLPVIANTSTDAWIPTTAYYILLLGGAGVVVASSLGALRNGLRVLPLSLVAWMILVLASTTWATAPRLTSIYGVEFAIVTLVAVLASSTLSGREVRRSLAIAVSMVLMLSAIGIAFNIGGRVDVYGGTAWRGVLMNQNDFGRWLVLGGILLGHQVLHRRLSAWAAALFGIGIAVAIVRTGSAQAVLVSCLVSAVYVLALGSRRGLRLQVVLLGGLAASTAATAIFWSWPNVIAASAGGDLTFSERTTLWTELWPLILERPVLGYGARGFWASDNPLLWEVHQAAGYGASHAHNTFLEIALGLGIPAAVISGAWFVRRAFTPVVRGFSEGRFGLAFSNGLILFAVVLYSFSASMILSGNHLWWLIICLIVSARQDGVRESAPQGESSTGSSSQHGSR